MYEEIHVFHLQTKEEQIVNQIAEGEVIEREFSPDIGALEVINKSEINVQIATAKRFPRSVTKFQSEAVSLVSLNEETAEGCVYALPRDGKTIEGPSARFAEVVAYSWGNCRAGARVVSEEGEFVTAQGVFWDLEKNTAIGYEVKRRIVDKNGRRYKPDMIGVTANAACSIALRNAILKGVPKAIWSPAYDKARQTIMGDFETLANRRATALASFQKFGVAPEQIFEKLGVKGEEDITLDHILVLRGLLTAIRDGDTTVEDSFPKPQAPGERSAGAALKAAVAAPAKQPEPDAKPATTLLDDVRAIINNALAIQDQEVAYLRLDEARTMMAELSPENLKIVSAELAQAQKAIESKK